MKKYYLFIALAMVAVMSVSCKNNKKAEEAAKATEEVVEAAKTILADDVLATIDELAEAFKNDENRLDVQTAITSNLTEEEKLVKPDYLLEAAQVNEMVTESQKINALGVLYVERPIRKAFGMPVDEIDEVMARLGAELNFPIPSKEDQDSLSLAERCSKSYNSCVENGDIARFWQASFAMQQELTFLIAQNPEPFFRSISDEQLFRFHMRFASCLRVVTELAKYDEEIALAVKVFQENDAIDDVDADNIFSSIENAKKHFIEAKDVFAARRAEMLK